MPQTPTEKNSTPIRIQLIQGKNGSPTHLTQLAQLTQLTRPNVTLQRRNHVTLRLVRLPKLRSWRYCRARQQSGRDGEPAQPLELYPARARSCFAHPRLDWSRQSLSLLLYRFALNRSHRRLTG